MTALGGGKAKLRMAVPAAVLFAILLLPGRAAAVTFSPTTTADGDNAGVCTPALCTLRDAINAASAGPGNDVFIPAGTYTLSLGELQINQSMPVAGANARTTIINAQGTSRVFSTAFSTEVTIRDVTVTGGVAPPPTIPPAFGGEGGGILNLGTLHLLRTAVVGNTATFGGGGVSAPFKGDFFGPGTVLVTTVDDSLIAGNSVTGGLGAATGGGLNLFGESRVTNSTITGNRISNPGDNQGAGMTTGRNFLGATASMTMLNTTIAGNSISGAGGTSFGAGLSGDALGPATITDLHFKNTIIAGNTGSPGGNCGLIPPPTTTSFNLSSDFSCGFSDPGSKPNMDPQLRPLGDYGGPTNTLALGGDSPALNTGTNTGCPGADQRGITRPQAVICDIGAFEAKPPDLEVTQRLAKRKGKRASAPAGVAKVRRGKGLAFVVTITNKGEQTAPGAGLTAKLPKKAGKVKLTGCEASPGKKKKRKKRRSLARKRGKKGTACSLGNLAPDASKTVRIKFRPRRGGKLVSKVSVTSRIADANPATDRARTQIRIKRLKRRR